MKIDEQLLWVMTSSEIGDGEPDLGAKLMELILKVLSESEARPARMIFLNSAIFLTTEGSPFLELLEKLEAEGTELVSCITCLNYHKRMERIAVGRAGDMKDTVKSMMEFAKVVTL